MISSKTRITALMIALAAFLLLFAANSFSAEKKPILVAHGGGFIEGFKTTNSVEAVRQSIAEGYKLIELDFDFSKDGKLVMIHDWDRTAVRYFGRNFDEKLTEKEFEKILINDRFQTLTLKRLIDILDETPDIRIITDVKMDNLKALALISEEYPDYIQRFIPQIYSYGEYGEVKMMGYDDVILTLYTIKDLNYNELISFIKSRDLFAVTVGSDHEHVIPDLKYKLADDGVCVYFHPVSDFETAMRLMENGVYGIYASSLVPADFIKPNNTYYLLQDKVKLSDLILSEKSFKQLKAVKIKNGAEFERSYLIDGEEATNESVAGLSEGKHDLKLILKRGERTIVELDYLIWSDEKLRVTDKRYEYRLDEQKSAVDMEETLSGLPDIAEETKEILLSSLIVKVDEYFGYSDGGLLIFKAEEEFLPAAKYRNGKILSPFADCITACGAESVMMDLGRYVYVRYNGVRTMMQANTLFISRGGKSSRLKTPLILIRDRTMASAEVYNYITGREYIENSDMMILLPENVKAGEVDKDDIFEAAEMLFEEKANILQTSPV